MLACSIPSEADQKSCECILPPPCNPCIHRRIGITAVDLRRCDPKTDGIVAYSSSFKGNAALSKSSKEFKSVSTASCAGLKIDMLEPYHKCFEECVVNLHRVNVVDSYLYNLVSKDPI